MTDEASEPPRGSSAHVFGLLWDAMSDVMGPATTAALLRRAARRGASRGPERADLGTLVIRRDGFGYRYDVPAPWHDDAVVPLAPMCALVQELRPLLIELTGPVVLRRLVEIPELAACGLTAIREEPDEP